MKLMKLMKLIKLRTGSELADFMLFINEIDYQVLIVLQPIQTLSFVLAVKLK